MNELPTVGQVEDAAASAMARLLWSALEARGWRDDPDTQDIGTPVLEDFAGACRDLLRGPLAEDYSRELGGYCMKSPTDPTLRALGHLGARLVEISYQVRTVPHALDEVDALLEEFRRVARS